MIIAEHKTEIIKGGNFGKEVDLRIKASPKAFKILSDGLYSDKISAVIRELSTNAYDAHVDAGIPENPFKVNLPNSFNPNFVVRDFGNGISPENIETIYTVFFESTKTQTNDAVGCLGLGCKSPLSYTDSFIVDSYYDGVKNTYSIYKNEVGIPSCLMLSSEDSDEPSGLCITVPVRTFDFTNFCEKAKKIYTHFKVKPDIGGNNITIPKKDYVIDNEFFGMRKQDWDRAKAIMGNVCYPLSDLQDDSLSDEQRNLLNLDIDIHFNIGELDVSASREKLSYDKVTVQNVKNKLDKITKLIIKSIQDSIKDCSNLWDARIRYKEIMSSQNFSRIWKSIPVNYKGKDLSVHDLTFNKLMKDVDFTTNDSGLVDKKVKTYFEIQRFYLNKNKLRRDRDYTTLPINKNVVFIEDDVEGKNLRNRLNNYIKNDQDVYVFNFIDKSYIEKVKDFTGIESFVKLSDIPYVKPEKVSYGKGYSYSGFNKKYSLKTFLFNPSKYDKSKKSSCWEPVEVDDSETIVHVIIDRFKVNGIHDPYEYINKKMEKLLSIGYDSLSVKVYGFKPTETLPSNSINLKDFVDEKIGEYVIKNPSVYDDYLSYNNEIEVNYGLSRVLRAINDIQFKDDKLKTLCEVFNKDVNPNHTNLFRSGVKFDDSFIDSRKKHLKGLVNYVVDKYPLLQYISSNELGYYSKEKLKVVENIEEYINLVEKSSCKE
jgi:hypothetical protein